MVTSRAVIGVTSGGSGTVSGVTCRTVVLSVMRFVGLTSETVSGVTYWTVIDVLCTVVIKTDSVATCRTVIGVTSRQVTDGT